MMKNCDTKNSGGFTRPTPSKESPPSLTLSTIARAPGGGIVVQPLIVTGPVRLFVVDGPELPPELLERLIVLPNDPEDSPCR
ncbi:MAG: hypothetical protein ACREIA_22045 [Opitutaceae bacterium]